MEPGYDPSSEGDDGSDTSSTRRPAPSATTARPPPTATPNASAGVGYAPITVGFDGLETSTIWRPPIPSAPNRREPSSPSDRALSGRSRVETSRIVTLQSSAT